MAYGATECEAQDIAPDGRVAEHKGEGGGEFVGIGAEVGGQEEEVGGGDGGGHEVISDHHLRGRVRAEGGEDVVLGCVCEPVEKQVDGEEEEAPGGGGAEGGSRRGGGGLGGGRRTGAVGGGAAVQGEDGYAGGHGRHDGVLVQRVAAAEEGDVEGHDGEELAALGE